MIQAQETTALVSGILVFLYLLELVSGPLAKRFPWMSPILRSILKGGPNLIGGLVSLVLRRSVFAPMAFPAPDAASFAAGLYQTYLESSGGLNYEGKPCPTWEQLPPAIRKHWIAVASKALGLPELPPPDLSAGDKTALVLVLMGGATFGSQGCAGNGQDLSRGLDAAVRYVQVTDPVTRDTYAKELEACTSVQCVKDVRSKWTPVIDTSEEFHKAWCALSPASEGCEPKKAASDVR